MSKKLLVLILIATMGLVGAAALLAGGGQEAKEPGAGKEMEGFSWTRFEGTTLVANFPAHLAYDKWIELISEFEAKTGMKVEVDKMQYMRMRDKQLLEFSKPTGDYDVIAMVGPLQKTEYAVAGHLEPLEDFIDNPNLTFEGYDFDDFIKALSDVQGKVCLDCKGTDIYLGGGPGSDTHQFAVPASSETSLFAYRKDLFADAGFEAPDTWDDVYDQAEYFYNNVDGVYGLSMRGQAGHQAGAAWLNAELRRSLGGQDLRRRVEHRLHQP
ncbi:MAG: extracellular solute-binding protein [Anaerolineales bacterium]